MKLLIISALLISTSAQAQYRLLWDDVQKPWRHNSEIDAAVQADTATCDRVAGDQYGYPTAKYRNCMARHHWRLRSATLLPRYEEPDHHDPIPDTFPTPSSPPPADPSPPLIPEQASPAPDIHPFCADPIC